MKLYGISNCDSVKKARKQIDAEGISYMFVDLKKEVLSHAQVATWLDKCGDKLVNKRSMTYRAVKADWLASEDHIGQQIELIIANPTLIKRPLIEHDDGAITVGFPFK